MIVWINGAFGAGKTTTAAALASLAGGRGRLWDPEYVGYMLTSQLGDLTVRDFQDWPAWRRVVVATGVAIAEQTGQTLIAPQSVIVPSYLDEVMAGFAAHGVPVFQVLIDLPDDALRARILADPGSDPPTWRLDRLPDYSTAREQLEKRADLVVPVADTPAAEVAEQIWQCLLGTRHRPVGQRTVLPRGMSRRTGRARS